jgi:hypothetical protein
MKELIGEFTADSEVATYIDKLRESIFPEVQIKYSGIKRAVVVN